MIGDRGGREIGEARDGKDVAELVLWGSRPREGPSRPLCGKQFGELIRGFPRCVSPVEEDDTRGSKASARFPIAFSWPWSSGPNGATSFCRFAPSLALFGQGRMA